MAFSNVVFLFTLAKKRTFPVLIPSYAIFCIRGDIVQPADERMVQPLTAATVSHGGKLRQNAGGMYTDASACASVHPNSEEGTVTEITASDTKR